MERYAYEQALAELTFARDTQLLYYDSTIADSGRTWHSEDEVKVLLQTLVSDSMKRHSLPVSPGGSLMERYGKLVLIGGYGTGRSTPLTIGANVFDDIINTLSFPKRFVQAMNASNGSMGRYLEYEERNGQHLPRFLNVFLQTPPSTGKPLTFTLRHDPLHPLTLIFLFTSDPADLHTLLSQLRHLDLPLRTNPQGFLNLILEEYSSICEDHRREVENSLFNLERRMPAVPYIPHEHHHHHHHHHHPQLGLQRQGTNLNAMDKVSTGICGLETLVAFEELAMTFITETFEALKDLHNTNFPLTSPPPPLPGPHPNQMMMKKHFESNMCLPTTQLLKDDLDYLNLSAKLRMQQVEGLRRRLSTHLQILKVGVGGADSRMQKEMETMSLAMRRSEDALKMICWLVMGCLPGLLVANILGSGIFILPEFGGGDGSGSGEGVLKNVGLSKLFPVFWAVSVPATLMIALTLVFWSERKRKRCEKGSLPEPRVTSGEGAMRKVDPGLF